MIESARAVTQVTPILMLGDSNTLVFDNLLFECPRFFAQPFVTRAAYCAGLSAATFTTRTGGLNGAVIESLLRHGLATGDTTTWYSTHAAFSMLLPNKEFRDVAAGWNRWKAAANEHSGARAIVLMMGTLDLEAVLRTLPAGCDFALDDDRFAPDRFSERPVGPYVSAKLVAELVAERVKPLARGLALLRDAGFENVYLHSLHPPVLDDWKYTKVRLTCTQAWLRYKVALSINAHLRSSCEPSGTRFLDMWEATTSGGVLDPRFEFDGDHLNRDAAELSACAVLADLAGRVLPKQLDLAAIQGGAPGG